VNKILPFFLVLSLGCIIYPGCKKPKTTNTIPKTDTLSAFADSLKRTCTTPFVGPGDSSDIYLPTAFTPNGDGVNDLYKIIGVDCSVAGYFSSFQLTVYDTLGNLVFQTTSPLQYWEGTDTATGRQSTKYKFYVELAYTTAGGKTGNKGTFLFLPATNTTLGCINAIPADSSSYEFPDQINPITGFNRAMSSNEVYCN